MLYLVRALVYLLETDLAVSGVTMTLTAEAQPPSDGTLRVASGGLHAHDAGTPKLQTPNPKTDSSFRAVVHLPKDGFRVVVSE